MLRFRSVLALTALVVAGVGLWPDRAAAQCRLAELEFTPVADLQIAVWIEGADGSFVDTVLVTRGTATYGLGNRPGRLDFDSEYLWPYGRRENVLPVWAHRRGVTYPWVTFQDKDENDLSHSGAQSSADPFFCQPLATGSALWTQSIDSGSCATIAYTDKGVIAPGMTSVYPPRNDLTARQPGDAEDMTTWAAINDLDAISRATPPGGQPFTLTWVVPDDLPAGDYVAWIEVSREHDFNDTYNPGTYPSPTGIPWADYGIPWRGQPSVVYQVPLRNIPGEGWVAISADYAGYGDPDGLDGLLSPPDATIDTVAGTYMVTSGKGSPRTVESFGAARLLLETSPEGPYRFRATVRAVDDGAPPGAVTPAVRALGADTAEIAFAAPADDDGNGELQEVKELEIRMGVGPAPATLEGFLAGTRLELPTAAPGSEQRLRLPSIRPETAYWVGVRSADDCFNHSDIGWVSFVTPAALGLEVDACFVATAAWGSLLEGHVAALRGFRDRVLRRQILGEVFIAAYYTFGPALAEVVRPSAELRALSRAGLAPLVELATESPSP